MSRLLTIFISCFILLAMTSSGNAAPVAYPVEVSVKAAETNRPVPDASVEFLDANKAGQPRVATLALRANGSGQTRLAKGFYRYLLKAEGFGLASGFVSIGGPAPAALSVWLNKAATLQGRLVDSEGRPVPGIRLLVGGIFPVLSDADGRFTVGGLDSRGQELTVQKTDWTLEKSLYIQLTAGQTKDLGNLTLRRAATALVTVSVPKNGRLASPSGITVSLSGATAWRNGRTSANGSVELSGLPPGRYTIAVDDERVQRIETTLELAEGERQPVRLQAVTRPPSLEIEERGDVFLPGKPVKMQAHGLWVKHGTATLFRIPQEKIINGAVKLAEPEKIDAATLAVAQRLPVAFKQGKSSVRGRGRFTLPLLSPGPYLLTLEGGGASARIAFLVTRLGLVAKVAPQETLLYAVDLLSGAPLNGVLLYGRQTSLKTDANGTAAWDRSRLGTTIIARTGDSLALLTLANDREEEVKSSDIKGYLYTERTVYRPGQELFFKGIFRRADGDSYQLPAPDPVQIKITDAGDKTVHEAIVTPAPSGSFHGSYQLPQTPGLGYYTISASQGTASWQGSFKVLEYRKPEFEVKLRQSGRFHLAGSTVPVQLAARYYFGSPVSGGRVTWRIYSEPYEPDQETGNGFGGEGHSFGGYSDFLGEGAGVLDHNGELTINVPAKSHETATGYRIEADVIDLSSRQVSGETGFTVVPSLVKVGIKGEQYLLAPGTPGTFTIRVSDWLDSPQKGSPVSLLVERQVYDKKSRSGNWQQTASLNGVTAEDGVLRLAYSFPASGFYRLRAVAQDSGKRRSYNDSFAWVWNQGSRWDSNYRELEAEFDKKSYKPGETARLILRTPAIGASLLLTLEGRRIHQRRIVALTDAVQVVEIPVTAELAPNIHVSVVAVHGGRFYQRTGLLKVDLEPGRLGVTVTPAQPVYAPGDTARLKITTTSGGTPAAAELSLAVVDEAIFAVAPETREDIYRFFRGRREHLVQTLHSFPRVYLGGASKDNMIAVPEDELSGIKVRKLFKDTAGWFPMLASGADGTAQAEITLPDNLTTWRATAIGHTADHQFGSGQATFITRLPFMARLSPPRFMVAGDRLLIPGIINEASGKEQQVQARFEAKGLTLLPETSFSGTLKAHGSLRRDIAVEAANAGTASLTFMARGDEGTDALELELPVLPRALQRERSAGLDLQENRGETSLNLPDNALAGSGTLTVQFAPTLADSLLPALEQLLRFPYGCVEQTVSRFVPLVHARTVLQQQGRTLPAELERQLPDILAKGLKRLAELQQDEGGWGWWKQGPPRPEMTALAMQGLALVKQAGTGVDQQMINQGIEAVQKLLAESAPNATAALYRALTAHGAGNDAAEKRLFTLLPELSPQARIAFAEALANRGKRVEALKLLEGVKQSVRHDGTAAFVPVAAEAYWGGSSLETTASLLSALSRIAPGDPLAPALARSLSRQQGGGWWRNTAASGTAVIALTDYLGVGKELNSAYTVRLLHNGVEKERYLVAGGKLITGKATLTLPALPGENRLALVRDSAAGGGHLAVTLNWLAPPQATAGAEGISLTRQAYRIKSIKDGEQWRQEYHPLAAGEAVRVGEDIELRLVVENRKPLEYVILENPLPAGFELRRTDSDPRYAHQAWYRGWYEQLEQRDRLTAWFIGQLPAGRHEFRTVISPELAGRVTALPAALWPMYRPELRSESSLWEIPINNNEKR